MRVKRFRHLREVELGPFGTPPRQSELIAIAGPNGGGKSSLLELVAFAMSSRWSYAWGLARTFGDYAFELSFRITDEEFELIKSDPEGVPTHLLAQLETDRDVYLGYNYPEGRYAQNQQLYNELFDYASRILRHNAQRSLGFFLRADRHYPNRGFQRESIFNFSQTRQKSHAWNYAFNLSDAQYADMYDYLVQQRYHHLRDLGLYYRNKAEGKTVEDAPPDDPLAKYDELLQRLFPGYKFTDLNEEIPSNLFVSIPSGEVIPFQDLSGGEKEVFFILSFFLRHDVSHAIILVDEPELHLHPELTRKLVQQMKAIRPGNQIWLASHNPEVIDEAGRDRTLYVARDKATGHAVVRRGLDEGEAEESLRGLFGYSGYIGVAPRLVFLEGQAASADRKLLTTLFPAAAGEIKFVPVGGVETLYRVNAAVLAILESELGFVKFYLIRDRDYLPQARVDSYAKKAAGKIRVLRRYHIENYLLHDAAISQVLEDTYNKSKTSEEVASSLKACAAAMSAAVLVNMVAYRLNLETQPHDFSQGDLMKGQSILGTDGALDGARLQTITDRFQKTGSAIQQAVTEGTGASYVTGLVADCANEVEEALRTDGWRVLFPGRDLLTAFAKREGLGRPLVLQNSVIKALGSGELQVDRELTEIIETIRSDGQL